MNHESIITLVSSVVITFLSTYFVTSLINRGSIKMAIEEYKKEHEKNHHQLTPERAVQHHIDTCKAANEYNKITKALVYIVTKLGGNPLELGLME